MRHVPRRAFTLIELLVVIAIIATLAGLLIPTTSMIQGKMKDVKCSNNLRQVALGLMAWRADHDDKFPRRLLRQPSSGEALFGPKSGMMLNGLQSKLLVCPKDNSKGSDTVADPVLAPPLRRSSGTYTSKILQASAAAISISVARTF